MSGFLRLDKNNGSRRQFKLNLVQAGKHAQRSLPINPRLPKFTEPADRPYATGSTGNFSDCSECGRRFTRRIPSRSLPSVYAWHIIEGTFMLLLRAGVAGTARTLLAHCSTGAPPVVLITSRFLQQLSEEDEVLSHASGETRPRIVARQPRLAEAHTSPPPGRRQPDPRADCTDSSESDRRFTSRIPSRSSPNV